MFKEENKQSYLKPECVVIETEFEGVLCSSEKDQTFGIDDMINGDSYEGVWS